MATELRAAWHYWQISGTDIYPKVFAANKLATVVWSTKVDRATWFGSNVEYTFGIQAMPITPISELLLRPSWVLSSHSAWEAATDSASDQWRAFLIMMLAVIDSANAWERAQQLVLYDAGNSKTNTLHWIATRGPPHTGSSLPPPAASVATTPRLHLESSAPPSMPKIASIDASAATAFPQWLVVGGAAAGLTVAAVLLGMLLHRHHAAVKAEAREDDSYSLLG